jgi:hypothetical protein
VPYLVQNELYTFTTYNGDPAPQYVQDGQSKALANYLAYVAKEKAGQTPAQTTWQK